jgi:myo-inositol-1(or 4)-monophosphatase
MRNEKYLRVALSAAVSAAEVAFKTANNEINRYKGAHRDIVTQSDIDANNVILKKLAQIGHQVISEEASIPEIISWKDGVWVVDPIDGSVNFAHGLEYFSTSVCYMKDREFIYGVVCAPSIKSIKGAIKWTSNLPYAH